MGVGYRWGRQHTGTGIWRNPTSRGDPRDPGPRTPSPALGSDTDVSSPEKILGRAEGALQRPAKGTARDRPGCQGKGLRSAGLGAHGSRAPGTAGSGGHTHMVVPLKVIRAQCCHSVESAPDSTHPDFNSWKVAHWYSKLPGHESSLLVPLVAARGCQLLCLLVSIFFFLFCCKARMAVTPQLHTDVGQTASPGCTSRPGPSDVAVGPAPVADGD